MKKHLFFVFILFMVLSSCGNKNLIREIVENRLEAGPFFLAENSALSAISINYVTRNPEKTAIYFTMVGDVDWLRMDSSLSRLHRITFEGLEESAVYQFNIRTSSKELNKTSSIKTVPYGDSYEFDFAVCPIDGDLEENIDPHFLILLSPTNFVEEEEFVRFYQKNKSLLSSTVIIPLFVFDFGNQRYSTLEKGFFYIGYKNVNIIMINKDLENFDFIAHYLSENPDAENYIVMGNVSDESKNRILRSYSLLVKQIYAYSRNSFSNQKIVSVSRSCLVHVAKKTKYAFR
jgi:hypothetical protein